MILIPYKHICECCDQRPQGPIREGINKEGGGQGKGSVPEESGLVEGRRRPRSQEADGDHLKDHQRGSNERLNRGVFR